ncbi:hypothetical protein HMPREF1986_00052 [Oribacterium sp. oral taxon 078 str. F0263]|uniref:hypothetical protein n=1 Tax=Oribacterium sp. oral taxon 078 TaxID=652706 RepID=UPI0003AD7FE3|nr:hypothetical protein [Oribacterium sp. oral taxon 078]ERL23079.1 hypothetical protein HMPREF1986_00052 [Oribacterium sp. oral taxon 078 str. F0263]
MNLSGWAFDIRVQGRRKALKSNPELPLRFRMLGDEIKANENNERKAPGAFAYAPEASLLLRRKD